MPNIRLSWQNPTAASADEWDVNEMVVFRKEGDHASETNFDTFRTGATQVKAVTSDFSSSGTSSTIDDLDVPSGTYTYGVFSKNDGGFGGGDLIDTAITV